MFLFTKELLINFGWVLLIALSSCSNSVKSSEDQSTRKNVAAAKSPIRYSGLAAMSEPMSISIDLQDNVTIKFVRIPAGKFVMGSPETEKDRLVDDEDQRMIAIGEPFYLGETKITVDQFAAFVKATGYKTDAEKQGWAVGVQLKDSEREAYQAYNASWRSPTISQQGDHPVVDVSWNDSREFCDWLSIKSGRHCVLPTSAQWEYVCRAGVQATYPWGNNPDDGKGRANCFDESLAKRLSNPWLLSWRRVRHSFSWDDGFVFTSPVKAFNPNVFGLYDIDGNASEWCQDPYRETDQQAAVDSADQPKERASKLDPPDDRVYRGGSWNDGPSRCRIALQRGAQPDHSDSMIGFRVEVATDGVEMR